MGRGDGGVINATCWLQRASRRPVERKTPVSMRVYDGCMPHCWTLASTRKKHVQKTMAQFGGSVAKTRRTVAEVHTSLTRNALHVEGGLSLQLSELHKICGSAQFTKCIKANISPNPGSSSLPP